MKLIQTLNDDLKIEDVYQLKTKDKILYFECNYHYPAQRIKLGSICRETGEWYPTEYGESRFWGGIQEIKTL